MIKAILMWIFYTNLNVLLIYCFKIIFYNRFGTEKRKIACKCCRLHEFNIEQTGFSNEAEDYYRNYANEISNLVKQEEVGIEKYSEGVSEFEKIKTKFFGIFWISKIIE